MNNIDKTYQALLQDILDNGVKKETRNGGTLSIFGRQIRHKMSEGFPLLTTKKMPFKTIVTELLWFLRGDTNIKYLVDNGCHIWVGDSFSNYINTYKGNFELDKEEFINAIKTSPEFAKTWGELGSIYGKQWRRWSGKSDDKLYEDYLKKVKNKHTHEDGTPFTKEEFLQKLKTDKEFNDEFGNKGIDQISELIEQLKDNPDSRRLLISAWAVHDLPNMVLPPCHYGFQVYTRELSLGERTEYKKKRDGIARTFAPYTHQMLDGSNIPTRAISLMWNQRSVDTPLGLPFNIASYGLLLEIIAKTVNMVPEELIGNLGDCHIYENQIDGIKEQLTREPFPLPTLNINTQFWPYEGGSCGEGPLDAIAVFNAFKDENFCKCLLEEDIQLGNYQSHPSIKLPLSN